MLLVPTDFSPCADRAVDRAIRMAKEKKETALFLHVIVPPVYAFDLALGYPSVSESLRPVAEQQLDALVEQAGARGVRAERLVVEGIPSATIIDTAKERRPEMILMGTHGRTGLSRFLIGSTTEEVVRQAPCPVLVIRDTSQEPAQDAIEPATAAAGAGPHQTAPEKAPMRRCLLCGRSSAHPAGSILCPTCSAKIEAEAREAKRRIEKAAHVDIGIH